MARVKSDSLNEEKAAPWDASKQHRLIASEKTTSFRRGFYCSGLVKWCYAQVGISIPRTTGELKSYGTQISVSQALPGDILWKSGHVGIYIGNGQYIHAPQTGDVVKISSVSSGNFTFARRSNEL